jgi:ABC-2 type transport system ATP-binding protein
MKISPIIETNNLAKSFGDSDAVIGLNLSVSPSCITAFLGLNGAGKSTTIKMLLGMISPTSGTGTVLGKRIEDPKENADLRKHVAYVSEHQRLYDYMTVAEIIRFTRGFYPKWDTSLEVKLRDIYELPSTRKIKALSKGMRRKLAMLLAFARRPELLILDEPSDGLDPMGIEQLLETMVALASEGTAIFFSSHQISEVERIADHVCVLHRGRLAMDASLEELRRSYRQIDLVYNAVPDEAEFTLPGVERVAIRGHQVRVMASSNSQAIIDKAQSFYPSSVDVVPIGLREIFLQKVHEG